MKKNQDSANKISKDIAIPIFMGAALIAISMCAVAVFKNDVHAVVAGIFTLLLSLLARLLKSKSKNHLIKVFKFLGDIFAVIFVLSSVVNHKGFNESLYWITIFVVTLVCFVAAFTIYKEL
ncbi:hypothetical protein RKT74_10320 [Leclercia pneumoniae]|uniref:hypothetical protein n=1 Tax=Leclercia pneumoniae TaxID=2815358 RepID=UPI0021E56FBE|nr:hypothetical protein [Leclercia pneumoniae]MCV2512103.1 hypothetical protein [Leclercia pneumoniae]WNN83175.1 hypothetical protein RKT74_10320 [Leclercia pneumoniae]